jgi:hypothetical protein
VAIELVFVVAVVAAVSCLAYLLTLTVQERRLLRAPVRARKVVKPKVAEDRVTHRDPAATSLRPSVARHHVAPSG